MANSAFELGSGGAGAATKAQQQTGTSTDVYVSPGTQQYHYSATQAWFLYDYFTPAILASYNVSSIAINSTGVIQINFTVSFAAANAYTISSLTGGGATTLNVQHIITQSTGNCTIGNLNSAAAVSAPTGSGYWAGALNGAQ